MLFYLLGILLLSTHIATVIILDTAKDAKQDWGWSTVNCTYEDIYSDLNKLQCKMQEMNVSEIRKPGMNLTGFWTPCQDSWCEVAYTFSGSSSSAHSVTVKGYVEGNASIGVQIDRRNETGSESQSQFLGNLPNMSEWTEASFPLDNVTENSILKVIITQNGNPDSLAILDRITIGTPDMSSAPNRNATGFVSMSTQGSDGTRDISNQTKAAKLQETTSMPKSDSTAKLSPNPTLSSNEAQSIGSTSFPVTLRMLIMGKVMDAPIGMKIDVISSTTTAPGVTSSILPKISMSTSAGSQDPTISTPKFNGLLKIFTTAMKPEHIPDQSKSKPVTEMTIPPKAKPDLEPVNTSAEANATEAMPPNTNTMNSTSEIMIMPARENDLNMSVKFDEESEQDVVTSESPSSGANDESPASGASDVTESSSGSGATDENSAASEGNSGATSENSGASDAASGNSDSNSGATEANTLASDGEDNSAATGEGSDATGENSGATNGNSLASDGDSSGATEGSDAPDSSGATGDTSGVTEGNALASDGESTGESSDATESSAATGENSGATETSGASSENSSATESSTATGETSDAGESSGDASENADVTVSGGDGDVSENSGATEISNPVGENSGATESSDAAGENSEATESSDGSGGESSGATESSSSPGESTDAPENSDAPGESTDAPENSDAPGESTDATESSGATGESTNASESSGATGESTDAPGESTEAPGESSGATEATSGATEGEGQTRSDAGTSETSAGGSDMTTMPPPVTTGSTKRDVPVTEAYGSGRSTQGSTASLALYIGIPAVVLFIISLIGILVYMKKKRSVVVTP